MPALYGLIGLPLGHSRSATLFAERFALEGIDAEYRLYELSTIEDLPRLLAKESRLAGLNVTAPYKQSVLSYCHSLSPEVLSIGASNVLRIDRRSGEPLLSAYNTDVYGFLHSLNGELLDELSLSPALILGSGGAARAVGEALRQLGLTFSYVSRNPKEGAVSYEALEELLPTHRLVVNASPVGYALGDCPQIPYHLLGEKHYCYDLIYNPEETLFLKRARMQGARIKNGYEMLRLQAEGAWRIWQSLV